MYTAGESPTSLLSPHLIFLQLTLSLSVPSDPEGVKKKYKLHMLREIENLVAEAVEIQIPL